MPNAEIPKISQEVIQRAVDALPLQERVKKLCDFRDRDASGNSDQKEEIFAGIPIADAKEYISGPNNGIAQDVKVINCPDPLTPP